MFLRPHSCREGNSRTERRKEGEKRELRPTKKRGPGPASTRLEGERIDGNKHDLLRAVRSTSTFSLRAKGFVPRATKEEEETWRGKRGGGVKRAEKG